VIHDEALLQETVHLPAGVLRRLARTGDDKIRAAALDALAIDTQFRIARAESVAGTPRAPLPVTFARIGGQSRRNVYDQQHNESQTPGQLVRGEGQPLVNDKAVNQAYDGLGATYDYWHGAAVRHQRNYPAG